MNTRQKKKKKKKNADRRKKTKNYYSTETEIKWFSLILFFEGDLLCLFSAPYCYSLLLLELDMIYKLKYFLFILYLALAQSNSWSSLKRALLVPHLLTLHSVLANLLLIGCLLSNRRFGQLGGVPVLSARLLLTTFLSQQVPLNTQSAYNLLLQTAIIMYLNQWSTQWNNRLWSSFGVWKNVIECLKWCGKCWSEEKHLQFCHFLEASQMHISTLNPSALQALPPSTVDKKMKKGTFRFFFSFVSQLHFSLISILQSKFSTEMTNFTFSGLGSCIKMYTFVKQF